ncbi:MAG: CheC, inhibitor of methylation [Gemmatimonadetes bacterium]|nr:CheC, inhibitor of methylation [Gemmatimonadota bacterium]
MNLDEFETDALAELFNVGLHRAAASLSEITGQRIGVDMPRLVICPITEIEVELTGLLGGEIATVHQMFGGAVAGDAVLLLEQDKAAALAKLMTAGEAGLGGRLDQSAREVLAEIGNIVLGACLSGFGDMLQTPVSFSVPRIHIESLKNILRSLRIDSEEVQYAVIAATQFRMSELAVDGYLVVAVGAKSLARISQVLADRIP